MMKPRCHMLKIQKLEKEIATAAAAASQAASASEAGSGPAQGPCKLETELQVQLIHFAALSCRAWFRTGD